MQTVAVLAVILALANPKLCPDRGGLQTVDVAQEQEPMDPPRVIRWPAAGGSQLVDGSSQCLFQTAPERVGRSSVRDEACRQRVCLQSDRIVQVRQRVADCPHKVLRRGAFGRCGSACPCGGTSCIGPRTGRHCTRSPAGRQMSVGTFRANGRD
jgi:hypothetical protein